MIQMTAWEVQDLTDHMRSRPTLWHGTDTGLWLRRDADQNCVGLKFVNGERVANFSIYQLVYKPIDWQPEQADEYLRWVLRKFTGWGWRAQVQALLEEQNVPNATELAMRIVQPEDIPGTEEDFTPTQQQLYVDHVADSDEVDFLQSILRVEYFRRGGFVSIRRYGEMLRVKIKIGSPDNSQDMHLTGFVRSQEFPAERAAELLTQWAQSDVFHQQMKESIREGQGAPKVEAPTPVEMPPMTQAAPKVAAPVRSSYLKNLLKK